MGPWALAFATAGSAVCLTVLAWLDPKRNHRFRGHRLPRVLRYLLALLMLAPGVGLTLSGSFSSLVVWFGAVTVFGWLLTQVFNPRNRAGVITRE